MTTLSEMQFELLPSEDAADGAPFGIGLDVSVNDGGFLPGADEWITEDGTNPTRGTVAFGRDRLTGPSWAFELHANKDDLNGAVTAIETLKTAWRAQHIRLDPGKTLPLRYQLNGRTRRVYGRPREFDAPPTNLIMQGFVAIGADFKCVDGYTYDDAISSVSLGLSGGSEGGFIFPVTFPVSTLPVGTQQQQAVVGGSARTYPVIKIGPSINPEVITDDWVLSLDMTIPPGSEVVIDTRPWSLSALMDGSVNVSGALGRRQWLQDVYFEPGRHDIVFRGATGSGDSTCEVQWRSAWNSI